MKTILSIVVSHLTAALGFADKSTNKLLGHWRYSDADYQTDVNFHKDGSFDGIAKAGKVVWEYAGKWSTNGDKIDYEYTKSSIERIPVGTKDVDKITELTDEHYTIVAKSGDQRTYTRVR